MCWFRNGRARLVERIFASHLEDWPALLRSLRMVGDDVREKARKQVTAASRSIVADIFQESSRADLIIG